MRPADRQKMCANCNGKVSFEATECPYCAAEQTPVAKTSPKNNSLQDSLASLYNPPYSPKSAEKMKAKEKEKVEPSTAPRKQVFYTEPESPVAQATAALPLENDAKKDFWALFALIVGGNLLTLGLMQFFFSENGLLVLEWNSAYWYLYCLIALPLFYLGFKKASST